MKPLAAVCAGLLAASGHLFSQDTVPLQPPPPTLPADAVNTMSAEQIDKLLSQIAKVQKEFGQTKKQVLENALARYKAASESEATAVDFYLACYQVVNIDRVPATTEEEQKSRAKGEWRERVIEGLKENNQATALKLQLRLLVLTLEAAKADDVGELAEPLRTYMQSVVAAVQALASLAAQDKGAGGRVVATVGQRGKKDDMNEQRRDMRERGRHGIGQILDQPVMGTLFAQAYNLSNYFDSLREWPKAPLDIDEAYTQVILPAGRAKQPAQLPTLWNEYINDRLALAKATLDEQSFQLWGQNEYKQLNWDKWMDLLRYGINAAAATDELMKIVRENPTSPHMKHWVQELGKLAEQFGGLPLETADTAGPKP